MYIHNYDIKIYAYIFGPIYTLFINQFIFLEVIYSQYFVKQ